MYLNTYSNQVKLLCANLLGNTFDSHSDIVNLNVIADKVLFSL